MPITNSLISNGAASRAHRCLLALLLMGIGITSADAGDGAFDSTFAGTGKRTFSVSGSAGDYGQKVLETPDGKILIGGTCPSKKAACLARFLADGSYDATYGTFGLGYARFSDFAAPPAQGSSVLDMIQLPDGRVAIVGMDSTESRPAIYVLLQDGTGLDLSVGNGTGYLNNIFGASNAGLNSLRLARQSDGKFIAAGISFVGDNSFATVVRILPDLSGLDPSFGTNGIALNAFGVDPSSGLNYDLVYGLALQSDGKLVIGGGGQTFESGNSIFALLRLQSNGHADTTFGPSGDGRYRFSDATSSTLIQDLAIDKNGNVVFGGYRIGGGSADLLIGRLTATGLLDSTFAGGTLFFNHAIGSVESVQSIALTADSVITASYAPRDDASSGSYFLINRFDLHGLPVIAFGLNGSTHSSFGATTTSDLPNSAILTERGLVVGGYSTDASQHREFGIARLGYEHIFASPFE